MGTRRCTCIIFPQNIHSSGLMMNHISEGTFKRNWHNESCLWRNIKWNWCTVVSQTFKTFHSTSMGVVTNYCIYFKPRVQKIVIEMHWFYFVTCWSCAFKCWLPQLDLVSLQIYSSGIIWTISSANWPLEFGSWPVYKWTGNHTYWRPKKASSSGSSSPPRRQ